MDFFFLISQPKKNCSTLFDVEASEAQIVWRERILSYFCLQIDLSYFSIASFFLISQPTKE